MVVTSIMINFVNSVVSEIYIVKNFRKTIFVNFQPLSSFWLCCSLLIVCNCIKVIFHFLFINFTEKSTNNSRQQRDCPASPPPTRWRCISTTSVPDASEEGRLLLLCAWDTSDLQELASPRVYGAIFSRPVSRASDKLPEQESHSWYSITWNCFRTLR